MSWFGPRVKSGTKKEDKKWHKSTFRQLQQAVQRAVSGAPTIGTITVLSLYHTTYQGHWSTMCLVLAPQIVIKLIYIHIHTYIHVMKVVKSSNVASYLSRYLLFYLYYVLRYTSRTNKMSRHHEIFSNCIHPHVDLDIIS